MFFKNPTIREFPNPLFYTRESWLQFMDTHSHSPLPSDPGYEAHISESNAIFDRENKDGLLCSEMVTRIYSERLDLQSPISIRLAVPSDAPDNSDAGVFTTVTSATSVPIASAEFIEDVYEHIISFAEQGKFVYEKFENLRPCRHDIIRGIIYRSIKNDDLFNNPDHPNFKFIPDKYSQYWKEAKVLNENGLL